MGRRPFVKKILYGLIGVYILLALFLYALGGFFDRKKPTYEEVQNKVRKEIAGIWRGDTVSLTFTETGAVTFVGPIRALHFRARDYHDEQMKKDARTLEHRVQNHPRKMYVLCEGTYAINEGGLGPGEYLIDIYWDRIQDPSKLREPIFTSTELKTVKMSFWYDSILNELRMTDFYVLYPKKSARPRLF